MVSQTTKTPEGDSAKLLYIIKKATREVCKYSMEYKSLGMLINAGEEKVFEYVSATRGVCLRGASGVFRSGIMKNTKEMMKIIKADIKKAQEKKGKQSWSSGVCPNCGSDELEYCAVCYVRVLEEIEKVNNQQEGVVISP